MSERKAIYSLLRRLSMLAKNLRYLDPSAVDESIDTLHEAMMRIRLMYEELKSLEGGE